VTAAILEPVAARLTPGGEAAFAVTAYPEGASGAAAFTGVWSLAKNDAISISSSSGTAAIVKARAEGEDELSFTASASLSGEYDAVLTSALSASEPVENSPMSDAEMLRITARWNGRDFPGIRDESDGSWRILVDPDADSSALSITVELSRGASVTSPDITDAVRFTEGEPVEFEITAADGLSKGHSSVSVEKRVPDPKAYDLAWKAIESWMLSVTRENGGSVSARIDIPVKTDSEFEILGATANGIEIDSFNITSGASSPLTTSGQTLSLHITAPTAEAFNEGAIAGLSFRFANEPWQRYYQDFDFGGSGSGPLTIKEIMSKANVRETGGNGGGCDAGFSGVVALAAAFAGVCALRKGKDGR
jgi:hypothetical protein